MAGRRSTKVEAKKVTAEQTNPFIKFNDNFIPVNVRTLDTFKLDNKGNKIYDKIRYEAQPCVKIFINKTTRKTILALPDNALRLYNHILYHLQPKTDLIFISKPLFSKKYNINSEKTLRIAFNALINDGIIAKSIHSEHYWINPKFFFFGSRRNKYPNNVKEKEGKLIPETATNMNT